MMKTEKIIRTAILGASGYTGAELVRLLQLHPRFEIAALTGASKAGKQMGEVYAHLAMLNLPQLCRHDEVDYSQIDLVFCCLPHGTTQPIIASLPEPIKIVDLSADFRLHDIAAYAEWYGHAHQAEALQKTAVYGLSEHQRAAIAQARLVANPGCYPTASLLPLLPLVQAGLIVAEGVCINALSGITGAGRAVKESLIFCETDAGVSAYGLGHHRHMAEIEQALSQAANRPVAVSFTPHLVPMKRGMLATIRVALAAGKTLDDLHDALAKTYANEPFVHVLAQGADAPKTQHVAGSNHAMISLHADRVAGYGLLVCVIDNLGKGASSQAVQNANMMFGLPEITGLEAVAQFP
jgi:N-acetyl-gamma-glutamyl-phosphate reductase